MNRFKAILLEEMVGKYSPELINDLLKTHNGFVSDLIVSQQPNLDDEQKLRLITKHKDNHTVDLNLIKNHQLNDTHINLLLDRNKKDIDRELLDSNQKLSDTHFNRLLGRNDIEIDKKLSFRNDINKNHAEIIKHRAQNRKEFNHDNLSEILNK